MNTLTQRERAQLPVHMKNNRSITWQGTGSLCGLPRDVNTKMCSNPKQITCAECRDKHMRRSRARLLKSVVEGHIEKEARK